MKIVRDKPTAVEWLIEQMHIDMHKKALTHQERKQVYNQAEDMEKEQLIEFGMQIVEKYGMMKVDRNNIEQEYKKYYNEI